MNPATAATILSGFRTGAVDAGDVIEERLLVVDVCGPEPPADLAVPAGFPAVVAAICHRAAPELPVDGPDVGLTTASDPPRPWVQVDDLDGALERISTGIAGSPGAAVTLVQLLRGGPGRSLEEGLVAESAAYSMLQSGPEFRGWLSRRGPATPRPATGPAVLAEREGDRLHITLNRPEVHNAYNRQMRDELSEILSAALAEPSVAVVVTGSGRSFCSGGDLAEFGTSPDTVTAHLVRSGRSPARLLDALSSRTEVVLHGACAGSGIELPAFAGTVRARPGTSMWLPELAMGLIPGAGGTVSLPGRIGRGRTAWMALTGEPVDAVTAQRWGLVDSIV